MTNDVIVIRSYSHIELIDTASLMFTNSNSAIEFIDIQLRMSYSVRKLKTCAMDLHHPNSKHPIAVSLNFFGFVLLVLETMYKDADASTTSMVWVDNINRVTTPCRTSYLERVIECVDT